MRSAKNDRVLSRAKADLTAAKFKLLDAEMLFLELDHVIAFRNAQEKADEAETLAKEAKSRAVLVKAAMVRADGHSALTNAKMAAIDGGVAVLSSEASLARASAEFLRATSKLNMASMYAPALTGCRISCEASSCDS
jgi:hypothetical protein